MSLMSRSRIACIEMHSINSLDMRAFVVIGLAVPRSEAVQGQEVMSQSTSQNTEGHSDEVASSSYY